MSGSIQPGQKVLSGREGVPKCKVLEELTPYSYLVVDPDMGMRLGECLFSSVVEEWVTFEGRDSPVMLSQNVDACVVRVITRVGILLWGADDVPMLLGDDSETRFRVTAYESDKITWKLASLWLVPGQTPPATPATPSGDPVWDVMARIEVWMCRMDQQLETLSIEHAPTRDRLPLLSFPKVIVAGKPATVEVEGAEGVTRGLVVMRGWDLQKPGGLR